MTQSLFLFFFIFGLTSIVTLQSYNSNFRKSIEKYADLCYTLLWILVALHSHREFTFLLHERVGQNEIYPYNCDWQTEHTSVPFCCLNRINTGVSRRSITAAGGRLFAFMQNFHEGRLAEERLLDPEILEQIGDLTEERKAKFMAYQHGTPPETGKD